MRNDFNGDIDKTMEVRAKAAIDDLYNDDGPCIEEKRAELERIREHTDELLKELD